MAQKKKQLPKPSPLGALWEKITRRDSGIPVRIESQTADTLTLYVETGDMNSTIRREICDMLHMIRKNNPNSKAVYIHSGKIDLLKLWRDNEILPQRLYFVMGTGKRIPHHCRISIYKVGLVETAQSRRELKQKGWLPNENIR